LILTFILAKSDQELEELKATVDDVQHQIKQSAENETHLNAVRECYAPLASRGLLLYALSSDIQSIHPLYCFSLALFTAEFSLAIKEEMNDRQAQQARLGELAPAEPEIEHRVSLYTKLVTIRLHKFMCRGVSFVYS
jgi:hypothetical protein